MVSGHCLSFRATRVHPQFLWLRVSQSLVFWVVFWIYCLSFCHFSFDSLHCLSFDVLWLPLWCFVITPLMFCDYPFDVLKIFLYMMTVIPLISKRKLVNDESKIVQNFTSEYSRFTINLNATIQDLSSWSSSYCCWIYM